MGEFFSLTNIVINQITLYKTHSSYLVLWTMCLLMVVFGWSLSSFSQWRANLEFRLVEIGSGERQTKVRTTVSK